MAVIISFLSANNIEKSQEKSYKLPNDIPTNEPDKKAQYTNEAPLYYLTKMAKEDLKKDGKSNEKIKYLFIVSKKVFDEDKPFKKVGEEIVPAINGEEGDCTFFEYYTNRCLEFSENKCEFVSIPYDFKEENGEFKGIDESKVIANNIYEKIHPYIKRDEKVYIDYTGGLRDINYLLTTLMQYFEINNASCESIVYSQQNPYKVRRIKFIYKINTIIQGAHDFIATGDITKLKEFFNDEKKYPTINKLISKLDDFVKAVSIGQIAELEKIKNEINNHINDFEPKVTSDDEADLYMNIFKLLFPKIKESLYIKDNAKNEFGYIEIVRWCIDHRYIQQAFTIYVEKFPEIYLEYGIGDLIKDDDDKPTNGSSIESTKFYGNFWDSLLDKSKIEVSPEKALGNNFKNFCSDNNGKLDYNTFMKKKDKEIEDNFEREVAKRIKEFQNGVKEDNYKDAKIQNILGLPKDQNSGKGFFNNLCNDPGKLGYYLFGRGEEYKTRKPNSNSQDGSETYKKKKAVIDRLASLAGDDYKTLISVMQAYLCVKIIRNNMNHAAATDIEKDETKLLYEVSKKILGDKVSKEILGDDDEIAISNVFSYDVAKKIIEKGVKITEEIKEDLITENQYNTLTGVQ